MLQEIELCTAWALWLETSNVGKKIRQAITCKARGCTHDVDMSSSRQASPETRVRSFTVQELLSLSSHCLLSPALTCSHHSEEDMEAQAG